MKKFLKKISMMLCLSVTIVFGFQIFGTKVYAAQIGQQLTLPEAGWQRIDDRDNHLVYGKGWQKDTSNPNNAYQSTFSYCNVKGDPLTLKFRGTKFRIIGAANNKDPYIGSDNIGVNIDGIDYSYNGCRDLCWQVLLFEKTGLNPGVHTVTIASKVENYMWIDAVDIDADGELLNPYNTYVSEITLNKNEITMQPEETENLAASVLPENATNTNITWTSSDDSVCTVDQTGKVTAISSGEAIITASANDGSKKTASCNIKVIDNRYGTIVITMKDGTTYTYDSTKSELDKFDKWYRNRAKGIGDDVYKLIVKPSSGAYKDEFVCFRYEDIKMYDIKSYDK